MDRRKYRRTVALMSLLSESKTIENVDTATFFGDGSQLISLIVAVEPKQTGTGNPSPENIRPLSGYDEANIQNVDMIYNILFPSSAKPVYLATIDVIKGILTVTGIKTKLRDLQSGWTFNSVNGWFNTSSDIQSERFYVVACDRYLVVDADIPANVRPDFSINTGATGNAQKRIYVKDSSYTTVVDFLSAMGDTEIVYNLVEPITYNVDPVAIQTFVGENNIWSDTGKVIFLEYES